MSNVPVDTAADGGNVPDVVTVGEAMALFIARQSGALSEVRDFQRATAGAELNVAVGLSRLGFRIGYVSRLGKDSLGSALLDFMAAERIDLRQVVVDADHRTGFMLKSLELNGADPSVEYFRQGSAASHLSCADKPVGDFAQARHLHLTGILPALSTSALDLTFALAAQFKQAGSRVSFDPNLRPRLWPSTQVMIETLNRLAANADLVMPGLAEGRLMTGRQNAPEIADFYLERGARQVVVKLGVEGAYYADEQGTGTAPGLAVAKVVDTVGAGDGFAVGVISALLEGLPLAAAAARGNFIGARVVQFPGDCDGLPTRAQLEKDLSASNAQTVGP
ncbi:MAG: sugar kinase [Burkholderiales bacterium]|nr:sugar kinase [Burkholderiales bacterium]